MLSRPATRPAVHPIRATRPATGTRPADTTLSTRKQTTEKLFDLPTNPKDTTSQSK
jgi:hypothetical protein